MQSIFKCNWWARLNNVKVIASQQVNWLQQFSSFTVSYNKQAKLLLFTVPTVVLLWTEKCSLEEEVKPDIQASLSSLNGYNQLYKNEVFNLWCLKYLIFHRQWENAKSKNNNDN